MASSSGRLPAALQVFPLLRRYPTIRPRRLAAVPPGNTNPVDDANSIQTCIRHIYHDLGVLAYAGCSDDQIRRVGDLIARVVNSGGPGAMITMLEWTGRTERRRIEMLGREDIWEAYDAAYAGIIKPRILHQVADAAFRAHIHNRISTTTRLDPAKLQLRERNVHIKGVPPPRGIIHPTSEGERILPVDAFTTTSRNRHPGTLSCEMQLYSGGGKGEHVGACRIDYALFHLDGGDSGEAARSMRPLWPGTDIPADEEGGDLRGHARSVVTSDVLVPLWELEGEVYGDKADKVVVATRYDKGGLGERGKKKKKKKRTTRRPPPARREEEDGFDDEVDGSVDEMPAFEREGESESQKRPTDY
ncbi:hypothetical protein ACRE_089630 [Hapsidospora chrysogenum ATCC 11550]|uniref:Uncharacterized protein n=1 Tax=Hapsidospora chrysogenum (strain ATCC 11550 / CBS 779.69 / DSM 880 / IAM 14645 / JCM 23072 / IMI 49137) TaxID=857340 RepID=A0A086STD8_HAPC1|nr:hypothetical protein ACRE_089630 [Hapsidospora chrysogenum ATCC 11550]